MAANPLVPWLCQALGAAILPSVCFARYVPVRRLTATVPRTYPANMSEDRLQSWRMATLTHAEVARTCI